MMVKDLREFCICIISKQVLLIDKKRLILFSSNLTKKKRKEKKTSDPIKAEKHYELFLKSKGKKIHKVSHIADIKSFAVNYCSRVRSRRKAKYF